MNFSRAAEELHLSQPAVSTQLKDLAERAGCRCSSASAPHLPHARRQELLQCARAIEQRLKETDDAMAQLKGVTGGSLNVAVISAGDYFFPRVLAAFGAATPASASTSRYTTAKGCCVKLAENLTDLAVMVRPPRDLTSRRCRSRRTRM